MTTQSSFRVDMALMCYLRLCCQQYTVNVDNLNNNGASLHQTTNHKISCNTASQVLCLTLWESTTSVCIAIYTAIPSIFRFIAAMHPLATIMSSEICGRASMRTYIHTIKLCLSHVYPWCNTRDKMYQGLPPPLLWEEPGNKASFFTLLWNIIFHLSFFQQSAPNN